MADMTLEERAQIAIAKAFGDDLENHMLRSRRIIAARAVIAELFNWLGDIEHGGDVQDAGVDAWHDCSSPGLDDQIDAIWTAMLAAKRKEALGE